MKKIFIELLLIISTIIIAFLFYSKIQKDEWVKESPEIKYSKERMEEVWGGPLRGHNPDLFYGTPLYDVAKAMSGLTYFRNEEKIEKLIDEIPKENINYQEGYYGHTIGHFALSTYNYSAIRKLLDKGLNPNLMDKSGDAIIIKINSSAYSYKSPESIKTLKYMIQKGANVNLDSDYNTPLLEASKYNLENVKVLVKAGANPHYTRIDDWGNIGNHIESPLSTALLFHRIDIVNYFIFDQKVDFRKLKNPEKSKFHPGDYTILYALREMFFKLNSKKYQEKMRLVAYLKTQGLDYWKAPIEERFSNNPNYTKDYLSKY
jgi:hypothetical protein